MSFTDGQQVTPLGRPIVYTYGLISAGKERTPISDFTKDHVQSLCTLV
jgi:hypothetical protein